MLKAGKKHPLRECLEDNSSEPQVKRGRFDKVVFLRGSRSRGRRSNRDQGSSNIIPRRFARAGKRKNPVCDDEASVAPPAVVETDENDIINELTKEFKKARLRPVLFTISTFVEQTVDEVGFTMAEEPQVEFTFRLSFNKNSVEKSVSEESTECSV